MTRRASALMAAVLVVAAGCASDDERMGHTGRSDDVGTAFEASRGVEDCADAPADAPVVVAAEATRTDDGWTASALVCSVYDAPDRYADAWRVTTPDGEALGVRELAHDHAGEQPFHRSLHGTFDVPEGVAALRFEVRDQRDGWVAESALTVPLG